MPKEVRTCADCPGKCCSYVAMELDTPRSLGDFEDLVYYLHHRRTKVCVVTNDDRSRTWYVEFEARCRHLTSTGYCRIYEQRPQICRDHSVEQCEHHDPEAFHGIATLPELFDFMKEIGRGRWADKLSAKLSPSVR